MKFSKKNVYSSFINIQEVNNKIKQNKEQVVKKSNTGCNNNDFFDMWNYHALPVSGKKLCAACFFLIT